MGKPKAKTLQWNARLRPIDHVAHLLETIRSTMDVSQVSVYMTSV